MRCHICNRDLPKPTFNRLHNEFDPCGVCLEVISNVFGEEETDDDHATEIEPTAEELLAAAEEDYYE